MTVAEDEYRRQLHQHSDKDQGFFRHQPRWYDCECCIGTCWPVRWNAFDAALPTAHDSASSAITQWSEEIGRKRTCLEIYQFLLCWNACVLDPHHYGQNLGVHTYASDRKRTACDDLLYSSSDSIEAFEGKCWKWHSDGVWCDSAVHTKGARTFVASCSIL